MSENDIETIPQIDKFYHLAALVKFNFELADDLYQINYIGTQHALDLAEQIHTKHFYMYQQPIQLVSKNVVMKYYIQSIHQQTILMKRLKLELNIS